MDDGWIILFQSPSLRVSGRFYFLLSPYQGEMKFQSPSLRGSGRFYFSPFFCLLLSSRFNPLHCGAVVASLSLPGGDEH